MAYMTIHCGNCGNPWIANSRDILSPRDGYGDKCPNCGASIDYESWTKYVMPAYDGVLAAIQRLEKVAEEGNGPLFTFDITGSKR